MPPPEDSNRNKQQEPPVELENQFILRLPPTPSASLRAAVRSGTMNLKDRFTIQLEPDMRHGTVKFDKWYMSAKVVDLPCLIESHKTLDRKTFYKTADICQMVICREEEEDSVVKQEEESPKKKDKKDSKDKKFLWPHGITPSMKNVRKRRFRKTLKKKYVDFPEIEKEVKRLFRQDNEAINVRYEVVNADDEKGESRFSNQDGTVSNGISISRPRNMNSNSQSLDVAEQNIFGEVLSSSEEDDVNIVDSADDDASRMFSGNSQQHNRKSKPRDFVTEFSKGMLDSPGFAISDQSQDQEYPVDDNEAAAAASASETLAAEQSLNQLVKNEHDNSSILMVKLSELEQEINNIQTRRHAQEIDIAAIENQALKQRFQSIIDELKEKEADKQHEYNEILSMLQQS